MKKLYLFGIVVVSLGWVQTAWSLVSPPETSPAPPETFSGGLMILTAEELATPEMKAHDMSGKLPEPKCQPPAYWDWRDHDGHNWMTGFSGQGSCGACWAFASIGMIEARYKIANKMPDDLSNPNFSEQFLISCSSPPNAGCDGGSVKYAAEFLAKTGVTDEACFPYQASNVSCSQRCSGWESRVVKGIDWGFSDDASDIKARVMEGPVAAAVYELNHAMCLCGWNSSGMWLFKDSHTATPYQWLTFTPQEISWVTIEPNEMVKLDNHQFNEPNDNMWDPGEAIDIITTLKSKGADYTGVIGKLSTTDSKVNISNDTYNFGSIPEGSNSNNSGSPFIATADASAVEHNVEFNLHITADGGYSEDISFTIAVGIARFDYIDVTAGNAILTVTDNASIGYDEPDGNGSGFVYPAGGGSKLYHATMAFGNSSSYLVDNWGISNGLDDDWNTTTLPNGKVRWVSPPTMGDTMNVAYYDDSGISGAKNVVCRQESWAFDDPNYDDFVVISFEYTNNGASTLTDLYSAIFADFDVGSYATDKAGINESKYLAWVSDGSIYAGITLVSSSLGLANASTVKNEIYVYPDKGMTDNDQYRFMSHALHFGSQLNSDYGAMVSAGPFDLAPGGSQTVVFAIVGGSSKSEIELHADATRTTGAEEKDIKMVSENMILDVTPNLMLNTGAITFSLPKASKITIDMYDITGRLCQNLVHEQFKAGTHTLKWNIKDEPTGIFFVRLFAEPYGKAANKTLVKKIILIR